MSTEPAVFVSYSHDNEEHKEWVKKLSTDLRRHGVDVVLDEFDLRIGSDLPFFMEQGLTKSRLIICVCSEDYVTKANGMTGGVGYEKSILTQALLRESSTNFIIPIIRNNKSSDKVPTFLGSKLYIDFENDGKYFSKYRQLLERIFDEDVKKKPPLGKNPFMAAVAQEIHVNTELDKIKYRSSAMAGNVEFNYSNNSGMYILGTGEYEFVTDWSGRSNNSIYALRDRLKKIGYIKGFSHFPNVSELGGFDYSSRSREPIVGEVVVWINHNDNIAVTQIQSVDYNKSILRFEYRIYTDSITN